MVFTTALTFSADEKTLLTVSADASALATEVLGKKTRNAGLSIIATLVAFLVVVTAVLWLTDISKLFARQSDSGQNIPAVQNDEL